MKQGMSFQKRSIEQNLVCTGPDTDLKKKKKPLSAFIMCQNIIAYAGMLSYNIDWGRESKSSDLSQMLIHQFKKEKEWKSASPTEVLQISRFLNINLITREGFHKLLSCLTSDKYNIQMFCNFN